jgi:Holliday junction resolvase RusA-like endonuclease
MSQTVSHRFPTVSRKKGNGSKNQDTGLPFPRFPPPLGGNGGETVVDCGVRNRKSDLKYGISKNPKIMTKTKYNESAGDLFAEFNPPDENDKTVASGTLHGEPPKTTSQGKRAVRTQGGGLRFFRSNKHQADINALKLKLLPYKPRVGASGPLGLTLIYVYPFKATERAKEREIGYAWHVARPDCDNIAKVFIDVLADLGFMTNDSQIVQLRVEKQRQVNPRILFNLYRIAE